MSTSQEDMVEKIAKLLAKAESSTHEAEQQAFVAKAQELMSKFAINEAMLKFAGKQQTEGIEEVEIIWNRYSYQPFKTNFLNVLARHNNVVCFYTNGDWIRTEDGKHGIKVTLVGYKSEVQFVQMLFASTWIQCMNLGNQAFRARVDSTIKRPKFWHSFIEGYSHRIDRRLTDLKIASEADGAKTNGTGVGLALRDRRQDVRNHVNSKYHLGIAKSRNHHADPNAYNSGSSAGSRADISGGRGSVSGNIKQLGR